MKDRVGQVWQLTLVRGEPIVLILATNPINHVHRVLVLDSDRWVPGEVRTLGNWVFGKRIGEALDALK